MTKYSLRRLRNALQGRPLYREHLSANPTLVMLELNDLRGKRVIRSQADYDRIAEPNENTGEITPEKAAELIGKWTASEKVVDSVFEYEVDHEIYFGKGSEEHCINVYRAHRNGVNSQRSRLRNIARLEFLVQSE